MNRNPRSLFPKIIVTLATITPLLPLKGRSFGATNKQTILIHAGHLIDGISPQARPKQSIFISDGKITAIKNGFSQPSPDQQWLDLSQHTVMPGLMDMHTHLSYQFSSKSYLERFQLNAADYALRAAHNAQQTLMAGFTTVRDLGDADGVTISLREAIKQGLCAGPRIITAGKAIASTGGHADPTNGMRADLKGDPGPEAGVINSPADAFKAVRSRYKNGADMIKFTATGGVLSVAKSGQNPQLTSEEMVAIMTAAHDYGMKVAAHAHGPEGMKRAILAGVDSIEHGTLMTDEIRQLMVKQGTWYVPTMLAGAWVATKAKIPGFFPDLVRPKAAAIGPQIQDTFAKALKAGIKIAFGTDSGVSRHGDNAQEFALMVAAGMKPMAAIKAATSQAAKLLGQENHIGQLKTGFTADIIAVKGDPLTDITLLEQVTFVMKEGYTYKQP